MRRLLPLCLPFVLGKQWIDEWDQPRWRELNQEALSLAQAGRVAEALALWSESFDLHPAAETLNNIAVSHEKMGNFREAHKAYIRVLNLNANNGAFLTLFGQRGHLAVDVKKFVAAERRKVLAARPSAGSCAVAQPVTVPAPLALPHLVNRSNPPVVWEGPTVLVVAHWNEDLAWLQSAPYSSMPRVVYQRHDPAAPYFSPNFGFEAGIYLQFIVEHYDSLPEQVVFLQGGPASHIDMRYLGETLQCLRAGRVPYFSFSQMPFLINRNLDTYTGVHSPVTVEPFIHRMRACARRILALFGVELADGEEMEVSTYCCATFTASRDAIRRHPWEVWRHVYELVGSGAAPCVWADGQDDPKRVPGLLDLNEGFIMEHFWHVIFGEPLRSLAHRGDETCSITSCGKYCPDPSNTELGMFGALR